MKTNLKNFPKKNTSAMEYPRNVTAESYEKWFATFEAELREIALDIEHRHQGKFEPMISIKELLGE